MRNVNIFRLELKTDTLEILEIYDGSAGKVLSDIYNNFVDKKRDL